MKKSLRTEGRATIFRRREQCESGQSGESGRSPSEQDLVSERESSVKGQ